MFTSKPGQTDIDVAHNAHDFAQAYFELAGLPKDFFDAANGAVRIGGYTGRMAEIFFDRCVGHWANLKVGTAGV